MKTMLAAAAALLAARVCAGADIIGQWTFNSPTPDGSSATGTTLPVAGNGLASAVGSVTAGFVAGGGADRTAADNSAWTTTKYPATNENKSAGVRFDVDTRGYENITLTWSQRHSGTASRYVRCQYTTDGATFYDADVIGIFVESVFTNQAVDLSAIPGVADNPVFGFRLVTEFESTALGWGSDAYVATKPDSAYGTGGTIRFDLVTVSGTLIPGANSPPGLTGIAAQTVRVYQSSPALPFTIWDAEDPADNLAVSGQSSDPAVVPEWGIVFGGEGTNRAVTVMAGDQPGVATVTIRVTDSGGRSAGTSFVVTVLPTDTPPFLSSVAPTNTLVNGVAGPILFTVGDLESAAEDLEVSVTSANPVLVPNSPIHLSLGGSGSNRTLILSPAEGQTGVAPITLSVSDGVHLADVVLPLLVTPSAEVVFYDPFAYPDGSLLTNSGGLWDNRSGTLGECLVENGQLLLGAGQTEDVVAPLIGGPYTRTNGTVLYAGFKATFETLPKVAPGLFAHFASGSTLRGRLYAGTSNAIPGCYHLWVANGSAAPCPLAPNLSTNTTYTLVTRYNIDTATTAVWINPENESDPAVAAGDPQEPATISTYGFRQDNDVGATVRIDDLRVGRSFAAVLPGAGPARVPLNFEWYGSELVLHWADASFTLQSAPSLEGVFTNVPDAVSPFIVPPSGPAGFYRLVGN